MDSVGSVVGGLLGGAAGGSSGPASVGSYYPNIFQNSQTYQNLAGNNTSNANQLQSTAIPAAFNNYQTASNNPYASAFQQGAGTAGNAYTNAGNSAIQTGQNLMPGAGQLQQYAQQVMQMGLDPQKTLYNQQRQGATDTANATNSAYGLSGPWAAGNTGQQVQNFDSNWQSQQLQRAIQALGAGTSGLQGAASLGSQANQLQTSGAADLYSGAGLPYNTAQGISNNQNVNLNDLISNVGNVNNIDSNTMSSLLQYLSQGSGYALNQNSAQQGASAAGASGGMDLGGMLDNAAMMAFL